MRTKWALAGKHLAGKGVHAVDGLDDDEKGRCTIPTPGGTQQMTVQHVRDEWRGVGSVPTPGIDDMGHNGYAPPVEAGSNLAVQSCAASSGKTATVMQRRPARVPTSTWPSMCTSTARK